MNERRTHRYQYRNELQGAAKSGAATTYQSESLTVGDVIGAWTLLLRRPGNKRLRRVAIWLCQCQCLVLKEVREEHLRGGRNQSRSCSCAKLNPHKDRPEYQIWLQMRQRCRRPTSKDRPYYEGIQVCARWDVSFEDFFNDVGVRPSPQHTLDRYPNRAGNYEPGNVRWATAKQQAANRLPRRTH